jgi:hypothetical protein
VTMTRSRPILPLLWMCAGLIAWSVQFTVIYAANAVACARGVAGLGVLGLDLVRLVVGVTTLLALAAAGFALWRARAQQRDASGNDPAQRFVNATAVLVSGLSLVVILWHGLPALIVPLCG